MVEPAARDRFLIGGHVRGLLLGFAVTFERLTLAFREELEQFFRPAEPLPTASAAGPIMRVPGIRQ
ncbi:hypothetical protein HR51_32520 [Burkholderia cepacia]|nr:hypothetical protein HR51_32520 [Burkholderia cepacia]